MTIILNGEPYDLAGPLTVTALLTQLAIDPRRVAVELNETVVKRGAFDSTLIREGDRVEVVNIVGGGDGPRGDAPAGIARSSGHARFHALPRTRSRRGS